MHFRKLAVLGPAVELMMQPREFADYHRAALEIDEARHNLILAILGRIAKDEPPDIRRWTLGTPGNARFRCLPIRSNRCHAKIGFKPICSSWHYPRA